VFRRRSTAEATEASAADVPTSTPDRPSAKGRPTPKRSEAEKARKQRVRPPLNRREALKRERERAKEERLRSRQAMTTGDERYFLERDKGPVRKFLRDFVDSRRTVAEFFLPIILLILLTSFIPIREIQLLSSALWLASMLLLIVDLTVLSFKIRRELARRFPDDKGRGHVFYAIIRSTQIRRLRMPKPAVKPGTLV
jgi:hypothetical protein